MSCWTFTLPETNIFATEKWMVGILSRFLLGFGLFSGANWRECSRKSGHFPLVAFRIHTLGCLRNSLMVPKFHGGKNTSHKRPRKVDRKMIVLLHLLKKIYWKQDRTCKVTIWIALNSELTSYTCHFHTMFFSYGPFKKKVYQHLKELTHQSTTKLKNPPIKPTIQAA